jgi:hypothetical protein
MLSAYNSSQPAETCGGSDGRLPDAPSTVSLLVDRPRKAQKR